MNSTKDNTGSGSDHLLNAGAAQVEITPPLGTLINGDFFSHTATYIHDPLYARAIVLEKAGLSIAIVVVDICVMPIEYTLEIRSEIASATGIPLSNILISTTHTHAAGSVSEVHLCGPDPVYSRMLPGLIVEAVKRARASCRPARAGFGSAMVPEHVLCRRYLMKDGYIAQNPVTGQAERVKTNPFGAEKEILQSDGPVDPEVGYLAVRGMDGKWIALLANYSLHYVGDWEHGTISSDYFGEFSARMHSKLNADESFVAIMSNGTSGDVNCWDFLHPDRYPEQPFRKSALIASEIAEKVFVTLSRIEWEEDPVLEVQYEELSLGLRKPSAVEVAHAKAIVTNTDFDHLAMDAEGLRSIYAREQVLLNRCPDTIRYPLQAIRIGDGVIGGISGEIFAETGLWVKAHSPSKKYFTIGLANGNAGYIPPAYKIDQGGYETWRCRYSSLEENAENLIREKTMQMLKRFDERHPFDR